ncbi:hypothetical protein HYPBUDRAFT_153119 [Hyphopichia burtonii NRRL Y-1933]|uniref:Zn(2)-C6 fungal-type domain-containing protein n=1 Tax=Hyphopichia burtonii NRRL Y-1933 TaxID=984485 RepID=A0A1E4RJ03_9ASCO|nr:hypothetical protein HYPBUDRAFT_153119 [Hyphopichia burtonii NRRL Y-1933]ODV67254.1 hypothetical protein HYPBUDRAFT_153119 [Hyphopichia burtonii NRRL Y-1933]
MDIFNSALKNPVPPTRKENNDGSMSNSPTPDNNSSQSSTPVNNLNNSMMSLPNTGETSASDSSIQKKRKNSRRKHRNSHLGCGTCKKRRIKCDENLPSCLNCLRGKLHCAYLNLDAPAREALRMAQFNQNSRQDRLQDHPDSNEQQSNNSNSSNNSPQLNQTNHLPTNQVPLPMGVPVVVNQSTSPPNGLTSTTNPLDYYTVAAAQAQAQAQAHAQAQAQAQANAQAQAQLHAQGQFAAVPYPIIHPSQQTTTHIIQSPYGPLVSIQPAGPYSQIIPQPSSQVYLNPTQGPVSTTTSAPPAPALAPVPTPSVGSANGLTPNTVPVTNASIITPPMNTMASQSTSSIPLAKSASSDGLMKSPNMLSKSTTSLNNHSPPSISINTDSKSSLNNDSKSISINTDPKSNSVTLPPISSTNLSVPPVLATSLSPNSTTNSMSFSNRNSPNLLAISRNPSFNTLPSIGSPNDDSSGHMVIDSAASSSKRSLEVSPLLPPIKPQLTSTTSPEVTAPLPEINKLESPDSLNDGDIRLPPIKSLKVGNSPPPLKTQTTVPTVNLETSEGDKVPKISKLLS